MKQYKAILFDWDGTLVQTSDLILDAHNHVRAHFGMPPWEDESFRRGHQSTRELYPTLFGDSAGEAESILYQYFEDNHLSDLRYYEDALDCLAIITKHQISLGLVSNKKHSFLIREVAHLNWNHHFKCIVGAGIAERDKPSGDPIRHAMDELREPITPDAVLYVGDTETDLKASAEAGCDAALIVRGRHMQDVITEYKPAYVFESLEEMTETLDKTYNNHLQKNAC